MQSTSIGKQAKVCSKVGGPPRARTSLGVVYLFYNTVTKYTFTPLYVYILL
jgi:hypothetical protein